MAPRPDRAGRGDPSPLLSLGFRPFFLAAALWLPLALALWVWILAGGGPAALVLDPLAWHRHDMLFGGIGAVLAGFLLTAVPNWTGLAPLRGRPLLALLLAWLGARLAVLAGPAFLPVAAAAELGFLLALWGWVAACVLRAGNRRNLPVVALLGLYVGAAALTWGEGLGAPLPAGLGHRLGLAAVLLLLALIGGRIVPAFTRNWLNRRGAAALPAPFGPLDAATLAVWALALALWVVAPRAASTGIVLLAAALLHGLRLARWQGHRTLQEPLVWVLHLAYGWLALGAGLLGLALLGVGLDPATSLHALTTGAIGTMTLAVMTRASLGHTGRPLAADRTTAAIYLLVTTGALARLAVPLAADPQVALAVAALLWGGAYLLFALHYGPMLVAPRLPHPRTARAS